MIEQATFNVTLTVRVSTTISFAPMERSGPITSHDAIENAIGGTFAWDTFQGDGFEIAYPIEGEAERIE
jgi:hypothetical protein